VRRAVDDDHRGRGAQCGELDAELVGEPRFDDDRRDGAVVQDVSATLGRRARIDGDIGGAGLSRAEKRRATESIDLCR
jgi:hypothetical protein